MQASGLLNHVKAAITWMTNGTWTLDYRPRQSSGGLGPTSVAVVDAAVRDLHADVVYVHAPQDSHQDHVATSAAVLSPAGILGDSRRDRPMTTAGTSSS